MVRHSHRYRSLAGEPSHLVGNYHHAPPPGRLGGGRVLGVSDEAGTPDRERSKHLPVPPYGRRPVARGGNRRDRWSRTPRPRGAYPADPSRSPGQFPTNHCRLRRASLARDAPREGAAQELGAWHAAAEAGPWFLRHAGMATASLPRVKAAWSPLRVLWSNPHRWRRHARRSHQAALQMARTCAG